MMGVVRGKWRHRLERWTGRCAIRAVALLALLLGHSVASPLLAQPLLVKDINPAQVASSNPAQFVTIGGVTYFTATDDLHGQELWRSDGTAAGTFLVKDINTGSASASPQYLTDVNGVLYFQAADPANGAELWRSDGTAEGTVLVADINPGVGSSAPQYLADVNGILCFAAYDPANGTEFWRSDGTAAGTVIAKDIYPGLGSSYPQYLTEVNGTLFFAAYDPATGYELWRSDGTDAGTLLVKDAVPAGSLYPNNLTEVNGALFFRGYDPATGYELWRSDGTAAGTAPVKDIYPSAGSSDPQYLTDVNGTLFFTANDPASGNELWKSDGTAAGTVIVKDIWPGASSSPQYLTSVNGTLYFRAYDPTYGSSAPELWKSDGTAAGTVLVKDITPGSNGSYPGNLTGVDGILYFQATDGSGAELWKSDGTAAGTVLVRDINPGTSYSNPQYLANVNGILYFQASNGNGAELWRSDGSAAGTVLVKDVNPGTSGSVPSYLANVAGALYFQASDPTGGSELWQSDGSAAGTVLVKDIYSGTGGSSPAYLTKMNGVFYFAAFDPAYGTELWRSDGTPAGTVLVKDIWPGIGNSSPQWLIAVNGVLYFQATDPANGAELWRSDGTAEGTAPVRDINLGAGHASPSYLTSVDGVLYFQASDVNGPELWKSDGTAAGTVLVKDLNPGAAGSSPSFLTNVNGAIFFRATTPATGYELWQSDGTAGGTVLVKDIIPGAGNSNPTLLTDVNGTIYFQAADQNHGYELWQSDGTAAGTLLVKDINPGAAGSYPFSLTNVNGTLYFTATDTVSGAELWKSDGSAAGTVQVADINPGAGNSGPQWLTYLNGAIYFQASHPSYGAELWMYDLPPASAVTAPAGGARLRGGAYTVAGTAADFGGSVTLVEVSTDGGATWSPAADTSGDGSWSSWSYSWTLPADGARTVICRATDGADNLEAPGAGVTVTVDNTAPAATATPTGGVFATPRTVTLAAGEPADIYYTTDGTMPDTFSARYSGAFTVSATATVRFFALDLAGNSSPIESQTYVIDSQGPALSVADPADGSFTNSPALTVTGSVTDPAGIASLTVNGTAVAPAPDGSFSRVLTLAAGANTITVSAVDAVGNETSEVRVVTLDQALPLLTLSTLANGSYTNSATLNVSGTVSDNAGLQEVTVNGVAVTVDAEGSFSRAVALVPGANTVTTEAADLAGNKRTDTRSVVCDETLPLLSVTSPADNVKTNSSFVEITGTVDESATVRVKDNAGNLQTAAMNGGSFSATVNLAAGMNTIEVSAVDLAGNGSSAKRTVTSDPASPSLSVIEPPEDTTSTTDTVTLRGKVTDALTAVSVTVSCDGVDYTPAVNADGSFEQVIPFAAEKSYPITVTAADEAGNTVTATRNVIYSRGTIVINKGANYTVSAPVTLDLAYQPAATAMQFLYNNLRWTAWESYKPARSIILPAGNGVKTVRVRFRDAANKVSAVYSDTIVLDTRPPVGAVFINGNALSTNSSTVALTLRAYDYSGVADMQFSTNGTTWSNWEPFSAAREFELLPGDGVRKALVKFRDSAGKVSPAFSDSILVDKTPPAGTVKINAGATATATPNVTLNLAARGAVFMRISLDDLVWTSWEPYAATRSVTLPPGNGEKRVYVQFRDFAGNPSQSFSDAITLNQP